MNTLSLPFGREFFVIPIKTPSYRWTFRKFALEFRKKTVL